MLLAKVESFTKFWGVLSFMWYGYIEMSCDSPEKRNFSKLSDSLKNGASYFYSQFKITNIL